MTRRLSGRGTALLCLIGTGWLTGCTSAPTIANPDGVPVRDVVQRIKCELKTATAEPLRRAGSDDNLAWFKTWTAKIDLTLAVSDLAQVNPTGSAVTPLRNAYPTNVGPSALGGTAIAAVAQKFTFGFNAAATEQRTRNEDITFTLSMDEIAGTPDADCEKLLESRAEDSLGFNEWLKLRVFSLVWPDPKSKETILREGYHKQNASKGTPAKIGDAVKPTPPKGGPPGGAAFATEFVPVAAIEDIVSWVNGAEHNRALVAQAVADVDKSKAKCPVDPKPDAEGVKEKYKEFALSVLLLDSTVDRGLITADLKDRLDKAVALLKKKSGVKLPDPLPKIVVKPLYDSAYAAAQKIHELTLKVASEHDKCEVTVAKPKDPPIDLTTYTTQFVITWNLGLAPSWTFLRLTGPASGTSPLLSFSRADTHTISVILAPSSGSEGDVAGQRFINALKLLPVGVAPASGL